MRISDWSSDVCSSDLQESVGIIRHEIGERGAVIAVPAVVAAAIEARRIGVTDAVAAEGVQLERSAEHTSELQSLMRISYAVFCLKKKTHDMEEGVTVQD